MLCHGCCNPLDRKYTLSKVSGHWVVKAEVMLSKESLKQAIANSIFPTSLLIHTVFTRHEYSSQEIMANASDWLTMCEVWGEAVHAKFANTSFVAFGKSVATQICTQQNYILVWCVLVWANRSWCGQTGHSKTQLHESKTCAYMQYLLCLLGETVLSGASEAALCFALGTCIHPERTYVDGDAMS